MSASQTGMKEVGEREMQGGLGRRPGRSSVDWGRYDESKRLGDFRRAPDSARV